MGMLDGKLVVVSGIGPGLGQALAHRAVDHGASVVLAARTQQALDDLAAEIKDKGGKALPVRTDITSQDDVDNLVQATLAEYGRVDALVNNAYAVPPFANLTDVDLDGVQNTIDVTLYGGLRMTQKFVPALVESKGSVLFVNSVVIKHSRETYGPYRLAKAALAAAAQNLATELGPKGVRVNSIAPGWIWGFQLKQGFAAMAQQRGITVEDVYQEVAAEMDMRRLPEPDEIADAGLFFVSDLSAAVTGQMLEVSCGWFHH